MPTETFSIVFEIDGRKIVGEAKRASKSTDALTRSVTSAQRAMAALGIGIGLAAAARSIIQISVEFEQLRARLQAVTGSSEAARQSFEWIKQFAATTPFEVNRLTEAFVLLSAKGFNPTAESFRSVGNLAAAFGRDIVDASQAITQAMLGEAEGLKQFGIVLRQQGDQAVLTFRGASQTIPRDAESIRNAVLSIAETNFGDAMARQMDTAAGAISNMKDAWGQLADTIGQSGLLDVMTEAVKGITRGITAIQTSITGTNKTFSDWVRGIQAGALDLVSGVVWAIGQVQDAVLGGLINIIGSASQALKDAPWFVRMILDPTGARRVRADAAVAFLEERRKKIKQFVDGMNSDFAQAAATIRSMESATIDLAATLPDLGAAGEEAGERLAEGVNKHLEALVAEREALEESIKLLRERLQAARDQSFFFDESLATAGRGSIEQGFALSLGAAAESAMLDAVIAVYGPRGKALDEADAFSSLFSDRISEELFSAVREALSGGDIKSIIRSFADLLADTVGRALSDSIAKSMQQSGSSASSAAATGAIFGGIVSGAIGFIASKAIEAYEIHRRHSVDENPKLIAAIDLFSGSSTRMADAASLLEQASRAIIDATNFLRDELASLTARLGGPLIGDPLAPMQGGSIGGGSGNKGGGTGGIGVDESNWRATTEAIGEMASGLIVPQVEILFKKVGERWRVEMVGLASGMGDSIQEATESALDNFARNIPFLIDAGRLTLEGIPKLLADVLQNNFISSFAELEQNIETATRALRDTMGETAFSFFEFLAELQTFNLELARLGVSNRDRRQSIIAEMEAFISGIAGVDLFPQFADTEAILADFSARLDMMGLSAQQAARLLKDAEFALDLFNQNLELDVLQRLVNVMERIPGQQEAAQRLQAEIDQARFMVELAILEIQLRALGLWDRFAETMRKAAKFAQDIDHFLPEELRGTGPESVTYDQIVGGAIGGIGDTIAEGDALMQDTMDAQLSIDEQILSTLSTGFGALDMTSGDSVIEAAINRQTDALLGMLDRVDRRLAENQARTDSGFNRLSGAVEARTRQAPTV